MRRGCLFAVATPNLLSTLFPRLSLSLPTVTVTLLSALSILISMVLVSSMVGARIILSFFFFGRLEMDDISDSSFFTHNIQNTHMDTRLSAVTHAHIQNAHTRVTGPFLGWRLHYSPSSSVGFLSSLGSPFAQTLCLYSRKDLSVLAFVVFFSCFPFALSLCPAAFCLKLKCRKN